MLNPLNFISKFIKSGNKKELDRIGKIVNQINLLEENIKSLSDQTHKNFEHIIIDGNSSDNTIEIIRKNSDKIHKWISEPDDGLYYAMNKGIKLSNWSHYRYTKF